MKYFLGLLFSFLVSCHTTIAISPPPVVNHDLMTECWMKNMFIPAIFPIFKGPEATVLRTEVGEFNHIIIKGSFNVEIDDPGPRHVVVTGLLKPVKLVTVYTENQNLYVLQDPKEPADLSKTVTVHIHASHLVSISHEGCGNVFVHGRFPLCSLTNLGSGNLILSLVNGPPLDIEAVGSGMVSIKGNIHLRNITAGGTSRVYLYWVNSDDLNIVAHDAAEIGLAGTAKNLNVELFGGAHFGGQYLRSGDTYVITHEGSHANVTAYESLFTSAENASSIYTFSPPTIVSQNHASTGVIISLWNAKSYQPHEKSLPWNNPEDNYWK